MPLNVAGLGVVAVAALLNGVFPLGLKFLNGWEWENAWLIYTLFGTLILPWSLIAASIPSAFEVLSGAPLHEVLMSAGFGFGWGVGGVLFGICVDLVGNALTFAIVLGLTSCIGSLVPFVIEHPDELRSTQALFNYAALAIVVVSLVFISVAGTFKDKQQREALEELLDGGMTTTLLDSVVETDDSAVVDAESSSKRSSKHSSSSSGKVALGLILCVISGLFSPLLNFPLAFCTELPARAREYGASKVMAPNTVWALALLFGMIPNALYPAFLLVKRGTWRNFCRCCSPGFRTSVTASEFQLLTSKAIAKKLFVQDIVNLFTSAMMGLLWFSANILYSVGAEMLGPEGPIIGWAIFICGMILVANVFGFILNEWKGTQSWTKLVQVFGLVLVCSAIVCLSLAGYYAVPVATTNAPTMTPSNVTLEASLGKSVSVNTM